MNNTLLNENQTKSIIFRLDEDLYTDKLETTSVKVLRNESFAFEKKYRLDSIPNVDVKKNIRKVLKELNDLYPGHDIRCVKNIFMKPFETKVNSYNIDIGITEDTVFLNTKFWFDMKYDEEKKEEKCD